MAELRYYQRDAVLATYRHLREKKTNPCIEITVGGGKSWVAAQIMSDTVKAWGGDTVLTPQTEYEETFSFTLIEPLKKEVLEVVYGSKNVTEASGLRTTKANSEELPNRVWVFDMLMSNGKARRIVVPKAKVTEIGDITYTDNEPVGYELTITAVPDASGNTSYTYDELGA